MNELPKIRVRRRNLPKAVELALEHCTAKLELAEASQAGPGLRWDLTVAIDALQEVKTALANNKSQPRQPGWTTFIYHLDERGDALELSTDLVDLVKSIEYVYNRGWKRPPGSGILSFLGL